MLPGQQFCPLKISILNRITKSPSKPTKKFTFIRKVGYSSGNYGKSLWWTSSEYFLLFFLTDFLGIPPVTAGLILLVSLVWDGISDPIIGLLAEKFKHRAHGYSTYLLLGTPLASLSFVLLFYKPPIASEHFVIYALITGLLFRTCYSLVDVPHNTMLASLTRNSRERTTLASLRYMFSSLGAITVSLGFYQVMASPDFKQETKYFLIFGCILSLLSTIIFLLCWLSTHNLESNSDDNYSNSGDSFNLKETIVAVAKNRQLWVIFSIAAITAATIPLFAKTIVYFAKYSLRHEEWAGIALLIVSIGKTVSLPVWTHISHRQEKAWTLKTAHISAILFFCGFYIVDFNSEYPFYIFCFFIGISLGGIYMLMWAMIPDVIEFGEWQSGRRTEASTFGLFTLTNKVAVGLGASLLSAIFAWLGFDANAYGTVSFESNLKKIMCALPIAGSILCILLIQHYKITHSFHQQLKR